MVERRETVRVRTYLGGQIVFNHQYSTINCIIRNLSSFGAKLDFSGAAVVPDVVDLVIANRRQRLGARILWRRGDEAGILFIRPGVEGEIISLERARLARDGAERRAGLRGLTFADPAR